MKSRNWLLPLVGVACGVAGFIAYRQFATPAPTIEAADVTPDVSVATAGAAAAGTGTGNQIPEEVPDIRLQDMDGKQRSLREFGGRPTIINFWATWCVPCRREIPLLNDLRRMHHGDRPRQGLEVLGIAVDFRESVADFIKTTQVDYPLLIGEQDGVDAAARFGMELVLPFSVFVDSSQRIVAVKVGELHRDEANAILATLQQLEEGKLELAEARSDIAEQLKELAAGRARKTVQTG